MVFIQGSVIFTPGVFLLEVGWEALVFGHFSPAPSIDHLLFLLYQPVLAVLRPRVGPTFPRLILVPSAHTQKSLEVVVKAEEYGSVRCRVLNGSKDSFP